MIISIIILIIILSGISRGMRVGFWLGCLKLGAYLLSLFIAGQLAPTVAVSIAAKGSADEFGWMVGTFLMVYFICHWVLRRLGRILNIPTKIPVVKQVNGLLGGVTGLIGGYVTVYVLLFFAQVWPSEWWQQQLAGAKLAQWIINETPHLIAGVTTYLVAH